MFIEAEKREREKKKKISTAKEDYLVGAQKLKAEYFYEVLNMYLKRLTVLAKWIITVLMNAPQMTDYDN